MKGDDRLIRQQAFVSARKALGLSQGDLAKWMYGENTLINRKYVSRKETGENPVSKTELCLIRALQVLHSKGVDLKSVQFSAECLEITEINKNRLKGS